MTPLNPKIACTHQRIAFDTFEDEAQAAAFWAKHCLTQYPDHAIAIISLDMQQQRADLLRILREIISPHSLFSGKAETVDFNFSLGQPLSDYPLIGQLLSAFQLTQQHAIPLKEISVILRSPFIGGCSQEWQKRAALDFALHEAGMPHITLSRLLKQVERHQCDDLSQRLQQLSEFINTWQVASELPTTPQNWSQRFLHWLKILGWPGDHTLTSHEYQQAERMRNLLQEFSALTLVKAQMSLTEAINQLQQLCEDTLFQPKTADNPLTVLGILEATGLQFDAIWVLGMDEQQWPPAPKPNPLLPIRLQREYAMPHASASRELDYAQRLTHRLCHAAHQIIASYSRQDADQHRQPSALISTWPETTLQALGVPCHAVLRQLASQKGQTSDLPEPDTIAPQSTPRGGSHLLNAQSVCPFQAVARFRLYAQPLSTTQTAPDARLNGQILHRLLQKVWETIQNSEHLRRLQTGEINALVKPKAKAVLRDLGRQRPDVFTPTFIQLEAERLTDLVKQWIALEKLRNQPFKIQALEERQFIKLNGLALHIQADRIDQLEGGGLVVIDYKSGKTSIPDWQAERPDNLQIPLYFLQTEQPVGALIAQVNSQQSCFRGIVFDKKIAPNAHILEDWSTLLTHWQQVLNTLAAEIQLGVADIQPKDKNTCTYCEMQPLCRINCRI